MTKLERPERLDTDKLESLKELFPQVFSDGKINFEALREELSDEVEDLAPGDEHYGLSWPGKREAKRLASKGPTGTLRPVPGEGVNEDTTKNLIIEGDNLEVLRIMQKAYAGRIKMIYIDPPYNTGGDFVYNDDFKEPVATYLERTNQTDEAGLLTSNPRSGGRFHTNWLNMMYPRLRLAKNLLRADGIIFVSIDDNEFHNLRLVLDEIFGAENFLCSFAWQKRYSAPPDTKDIGYEHESILCFRKSEAFVRNLLPLTEEQKARYKNPDNDIRGPWKAENYTCRYTADERPNLYYPIQNPNTGEEVWPKRTRVWASSRAVTQQHLMENRIWWGLDGKNSTPALKNFITDIQQGAVPSTLLKHERVGHTDEAAKELRKLIPDLKFTPKPTRLIKYFTAIGTRKDDIVLDFFAGTGTTGHAVMSLNAEDGGARQFILVQLPEPNTDQATIGRLPRISDITTERVQLAAKHELASATHSDNGFKKLTLALSNLKKLHEASLESQRGLFTDIENPIAEYSTKLDLLTELMLIEGYPLDSKILVPPTFTVNTVTKVKHPDQDTQLLICLDETIAEETVAKAAQYLKTTFICLDSALSDETKLQLDDKITLKTL